MSCAWHSSLSLELLLGETLEGGVLVVAVEGLLGRLHVGVDVAVGRGGLVTRKNVLLARQSLKSRLRNDTFGTSFCQLD